MSTAPQGWQNPKTNWQAADIVHPTDLNRIEGNLQAIEGGSRTLDPSQVPSGNTGSLRQLLDWFANRIRAITGASNWYDSPATTLAATKSHMDATSGIHGAPPGARLIHEKDVATLGEVPPDKLVPSLRDGEILQLPRVIIGNPRATGGQSIPNSTPTVVEFPNGYSSWRHSGTNQFSVPGEYFSFDAIGANGLVLVSAILRFQSNASGIRRAELWRNDGLGDQMISSIELGASSSSDTDVHIPFLVDVVASDSQYYFVKAFQNSGSSLLLRPQSQLVIWLIRSRYLGLLA